MGAAGAPRDGTVGGSQAVTISSISRAGERANARSCRDGARIAYHHPMRVMITMVVMVAACRFSPDDGTGVSGDAASADAAAADASAIDAAVIDAQVIDAAPADARPPCPTSYDVTHQGRRYDFRQIAQQQALAALDCADDLAGRTHLATFEIPADVDGALTAINPGIQATPYVGAKCGAVDCNFAASWVWITDVAIDAAAWAEFQPDNGLTERAVRIERDRNDGHWRLVNVVPTSTLPYICECEP